MFTALFKYFVEIMFSLGLFFNAILFVPQIVKLIKIKDSRELSLLTFGGFSFIQVFIILHGIISNDYLLIVGYSASLIMCGFLTALIVWYRLNKK